MEYLWNEENMAICVYGINLEEWRFPPRLGFTLATGCKFNIELSFWPVITGQQHWLGMIVCDTMLPCTTCTHMSWTASGWTVIAIYLFRPEKKLFFSEKPELFIIDQHWRLSSVQKVKHNRSKFKLSSAKEIRLRFMVYDEILYQNVVYKLSINDSNSALNNFHRRAEEYLRALATWILMREVIFVLD